MSTGWSAEELEIRHAPFGDQLREAKAKAYDIEVDRGRVAHAAAETKDEEVSGRAPGG